MKLQGSIKEVEDAKHQHLVKELLVKTILMSSLNYFQWSLETCIRICILTTPKQDSKSRRKKSLSEALDNRQLTRKDLLMK